MTKRYQQSDPNQVADLRAYWEKRKGEPFVAYLPGFRYESYADLPKVRSGYVSRFADVARDQSLAAAHREMMTDADWLALCNRLAATMKILRPWADVRRPICLRDIREVLCDLRRAAAEPFSGIAVEGWRPGDKEIPFEHLLPHAYHATTRPFDGMVAAEIGTLLPYCLVALRTECGPLLDDSEAHLTAADRERIDNKLLLQQLAEIPISSATVPGIDYMPDYTPKSAAWVFRTFTLARERGLPHPDSQFRLLEWLPLSARDPHFDNDGRYITRREAAERREREAFERRLVLGPETDTPPWL